MDCQLENAISNKSLNVLLVEDNSDYAEMVINVLKTTLNQQVKVLWEQRLAAGMARLDQMSIDVILLDMSLPDSTGIETLQKTIVKAPDLPIVIITGYADEKQDLKALHEGAQDYLIKGQNEVTLLPKAICYAIERKRVHRALLESDARFRQLIERSADPIAIIDGQYIIRFVNPAMTQLFGRKQEELLGSLFGFPLPQNGDFSEIEIINHQAKTIIAEMRTVPIQWEKEPVHLASLRDITDHKRMLVELEQNRRQDLLMKDVFLSKVSHELRSPLSVIHQFTTILLDEISGGINSEQRDNLEIILRNAEDLRDMIDDLLQITRKEIDTVVPAIRSNSQEINIVSECFQIQALIHETMNMLRTIASKNNISLTSNIPKDLAPIHADPHRIKQVLNNLINNAIKFTPINGSVHVKGQIDQKDAAFIRITVEDTGPGVPVEEQEKIFEYLYQQDFGIDDRRKGLGIGLYICREIVTRHGGRIWVESQPQTGSKFHFTLPIFSLERLIKTILTADKIVNGNIGMIRVDVAFDPPRKLTGQDAKTLNNIWKILNLCVLPDLDLVLPRVGKYLQGEIFFILASATPNGINALIRRIKAQLKQQTDLNEKGLNTSITSIPIDIPDSFKQQPYRSQSKKIIKIIDDLIDHSLLGKRR
jgi:signal transduction histidine kinase